MVTAELFQSDSELLIGFHLAGHAGAGQYGEDIVCAAVSSACYLVANTVTEILHIDARVTVQEGDMTFTISRKDAPACQPLLSGLRLHLTQLGSQYPDHILVKTTEV